MKTYQVPKRGDLREVKIELTKDCPLACIHCSSKAYPGNPIELPRELVLSIIDQAATMRVKSIVLSGGEPLLWAWIDEAVTRCAQHGLRCSIYSTGIARNGNGAERISALSKLGLNRAVFSIHSPLREHHELITRGIGSFDKTIGALNSVGGEVAKEIHFVPLRRNFRHLDGLIDLAFDAGVDTVSVLRFVPQGRGSLLKKSREMLGKNETGELRRLVLRSRRRQPNVRIRLGSPYNIMALDDDADCTAATDTLSIGPNGNVYPCDAFKNIEPSDIGLVDPSNNVAVRSLKQCWENSTYLNAVRRYLTTPFGEPCWSCRHLQQCKSGCLAQKVLEQETIDDGNISKRPDPLCLASIIGG